MPDGLIPVETIVIEMKEIDRAIVDGEAIGFFKLLVRENSDQIMGAALMASLAGDMISELSVAMTSEKGLIAMSQAIHPFPTQVQILRIAADTLLKKRETQ